MRIRLTRYPGAVVLGGVLGEILFFYWFGFVKSLPLSFMLWGAILVGFMAEIKEDL